MSDTIGHRTTFGERAAGKWQIPALFVSSILLAIVALQIKSPARKLGIDANLERINNLITSRFYVPALDLTRQLLTWQDISDKDRGTLHAYAARAVFERAMSIGELTEEDSGETLEHYKQAIEFRFPLGAVDHRRIAASNEAVGQLLLARSHYQAAADLSPPPALTDKRKIITLGAALSSIPAEETDGLLDSFCVEAKDSPEDLIWALEKRVNRFDLQNQPTQIAPLLDQYREQFAETEYEPNIQYLTLLGLRGVGQYDEAERGLRALLNDIPSEHVVRPRAAWLLGTIVLNDGGAQRPEEALSIFRDVVDSRRDREYTAASVLGMAEASALMQRFDDSLEHYATLIDQFRRPQSFERVTRNGVATAISATADLARANNEVRYAIEFLQLAAGLIDPEDEDNLSRLLIRLGNLQVIEARGYQALRPDSDTSKGKVLTEDPPAPWDAQKSMQLFNAAGETFVKVSWLSTLNEERASDTMWTAASLFDEGGNHERAIEIMRAFVRDRSDAEIIPRVLLRLGRSLQAVGRCEEAVEVYQRNISSHPRSPFANAALIPLAECLMARGGEFEAQAEAALLQIRRDSEIFTPDAPEFRDALFLSGDLYVRRAAYEKAIPVIEEFLQRYPDDSRRLRGQFLLADAYRQSALAIKEELLQPEFVGESKRLKFELQRRLSIAAQHFRELIDEMTPGENQLDELEQVYLQDARLYEASCLFELERYEEALGLYERVAWIYKDRPVALGAYVQVINCNILLGRPSEAASALRRAQYLVGVIDEKYFSVTGELETRESWQEHFEWVAEVLADGTS